MESNQKNNFKEQIDNIKQLTLGCYIEEKVRKLSPIKDYAYLYSFLYCIINNTNYGGNLIEEFENIREKPLIFMGTHEEFITDKNDLATYMMYYLICKYAKIKTPAIQLSSSVTCIQNNKTKQGPAFFTEGNERYPIFEYPSLKKLKSIAAGNLFKFKFNDVFVKSIRGKIFDFSLKYDKSFRETVFEVNFKLISKNDFTPNFSDDNSVSMYISDLLKSDDKFSELIFINSTTRELFLTIKKDIILRERNSVLKDSTDLFYFNQDGKLIPIYIIYNKNTSYIHSRINNEILCSFCRKNELISLLRKNILFPDLIVSYTYSSILTGLNPVGGPSQMIYFPLILEIYKNFTARVVDLNNISSKYRSVNSILSMGILNTLRNKEISFDINQCKELLNKKIEFLIDDDFYNYIYKLIEKYEN